MPSHRQAHRIPIPEEPNNAEEFLPYIPGQNRNLPKHVNNLQDYGRALIMHGQTHRGKTYFAVYKNFSKYRDWVKAHAREATGALLDFANYCEMLD